MATLVTKKLQGLYATLLYHCYTLAVGLCTGNDSYYIWPEMSPIIYDILLYMTWLVHMKRDSWPMTHAQEHYTTRTLLVRVCVITVWLDSFRTQCDSSTCGMTRGSRTGAVGLVRTVGRCVWRICVIWLISYVASRIHMWRDSWLTHRSITPRARYWYYMATAYY